MSKEYLQIPNYLCLEEFYTEAQKRMKKLEEEKTTMILLAIDLDNFNYINDFFGYEIGDDVLHKIAEKFSGELEEKDIFTKVHADHFVFCMGAAESTDIAKKFLRMADLKEALKESLPMHYNTVVCGGIVVVHNNKTPLTALLDKANYARKAVKGSMHNSFRFYDKKMEEEIEWQKIVTYTMESALKNHEFEMYLQPKIVIKSDQIIGAEALVRWNSKSHGMIYPDRFIPIMERNGFIRQLDFFMLEEACRFLNENKKNDIAQLPISVNFSKLHLSSERLVEKIFQTVNRHAIPTSLIEIEFTESLSVEDYNKLAVVVTDLKLLGFKVSLDDFGSAYSSLSCLKDLPFDIVKIDKQFLDSSNTEKGRLIITKIVEMVKSLHMLSVMEGVEETEQVELLRKLSCDFGQGYFYAKPMPQDAYVEYMKSGSVMSDMKEYLSERDSKQDKSYLCDIPQEFQMDNWELYTLGKNIDVGLMKGYLDGDATVQYVNDKALEYLGYSRQEFREIFNNSIVAFTHPEDAPLVRKNTEQLIATGEPLKFETRAIRKDGKVIVLQGRSSCVIDNQGRPVGIYAFRDVTEEVEHVEKLRRSLEEKNRELEKRLAEIKVSEERYRVIVEQSNDILFDWDFESDTIFFEDLYKERFGREPIVSEVTSNMKIRDRIHSDDLGAFEEWIQNTYKKQGKSVAEYRMLKADGSYIWMQCRSTAICDENGNALRAVGTFSDINEQKEELDSLLVMSQRDSLTKLFNKEETRKRIEHVLESNKEQIGAFFIIDIDNFKGVNDNLGHQLGDTVLIEVAEKVQQVFPEQSIIGRIGGDEIAAYIWADDESEVCKKAEILMKELRVAYYGSSQKYKISGSVGIALYPSHGTDFGSLYQCADIALYESKNNGKDQFTVYQKEIARVLQDNRTPVECSDSFLDRYFANDFPFKVFEILYETKDFEASFEQILRLLGMQFGIDHVYISQKDESGQFMNCTYEWCREGIAPKIRKDRSFAINKWKKQFLEYTKEGVLCCSDVRKMEGVFRDIYRLQGIKSLLRCAIYNEGECVGFIGFDICREYHEWTGEEIATLGYISRILSVFIIKTKTANKLRMNYKNYMEMLNNLNGFVYVVDLNTYEILYSNYATRELGVVAGKTCYEQVFQSETPCLNCPIRRMSKQRHFATTEIYSIKTGGWVSAAASRLKWEGEKEAALVCCTDISEYKRN